MNAGSKSCLIIFDDLLNEVYSERESSLFKKGSHHRNISVILVTHNTFHRPRYCRDISLNAKWIVFLENIRNNNQFTRLALQVFPEDSTRLYDAYLDATAKPHGYFVLDISQDRTTYCGFEPTYFQKSYHPKSILLTQIRIHPFACKWWGEWRPTITLSKFLKLQDLNYVKESFQIVTRK